MAKSTRRTTKVVAMPGAASTTVLSPSPRPTDIEIAKRAFELYCERGCQAGRDVEDWLQAERELQETASSAAVWPEVSAGSLGLMAADEPAGASA
jgi:hypothetical protein